MIHNALVMIPGVVVGNVLGFFAKESILIHGLETVRKEMHRIVTDVASQRFGPWAGATMGYTAALDYALPVTNIIGDIVWETIAEIFRSGTFITARSFGLIKETEKKLPSMTLTAIRITCMGIANTCKFLIIRSGMSIGTKSIELFCSTVIPTLIRYHILPAFIFAPLVGASSAMLTPLVVILCADLICVIMQEILFQTSTKAAEAFVLLKK